MTTGTTMMTTGQTTTGNEPDIVDVAVDEWLERLGDRLPVRASVHLFRLNRGGAILDRDTGDETD